MNRVEQLYEQLKVLEGSRESIDIEIAEVRAAILEELSLARAPEIKDVVFPLKEELTHESARVWIDIRYPGYEFVSIVNGLVRIQEKLDFVPRQKVSFEDGGDLSVRITRGTPSVDTSSLKDIDPDLYSRIVKEVTIERIDEKELKKALEEDPSKFEAIQDALVPKRPSATLVVRRGER